MLVHSFNSFDSLARSLSFHSFVSYDEISRKPTEPHSSFFIISLNSLSALSSLNNNSISSEIKAEKLCEISEFSLNGSFHLLDELWFRLSNRSTRHFNAWSVRNIQYAHCSVSGLELFQFLSSAKRSSSRPTLTVVYALLSTTGYSNSRIHRVESTANWEAQKRATAASTRKDRGEEKLYFISDCDCESCWMNKWRWDTERRGEREWHFELRRDILNIMYDTRQKREWKRRAQKRRRMKHVERGNINSAGSNEELDRNSKSRRGRREMRAKAHRSHLSVFFYRKIKLNWCKNDEDNKNPVIFHLLRRHLFCVFFPISQFGTLRKHSTTALIEDKIIGYEGIGQQEKKEKKVDSIRKRERWWW